MAKVAYVTGGMGGIGTAICRKFHDAGYKVIAGCGPTRDHAKWLAEQKADGYTFTASVGNVSDWDSTKQAFEKVKSEHGNVDILVNNAGITRDGVFRKMSLEDWRAVMDTNLNSMFNVTKQVIDGMLDKGWGRIINIASVNGEKGQFGQTNYSAAKAGMHGFTMALAQEVASKGVTVNTVVARLHRHRHGDGGARRRARKDHPDHSGQAISGRPRRSDRSASGCPATTRDLPPAPSFRATVDCTWDEALTYIGAS